MPEGTAGTAVPPDEAEVERVVRERQARRRAAEESGDDADARTGADLMKAAADVAAEKPGAKLTDEEVHDALEVFMEAQDDPDRKIEPKPLKLNVGTEKNPKWVRWVVIPVDDGLIAKFRKQASKGTKQQRLRGEAETDELLVARKMVVAGTIEPDIGDLAGRLRMADPSDAVLAFFRKFGKTGLIVQISGQILSLSGYDEDDVVSEVDAAGG